MGLKAVSAQAGGGSATSAIVGAPAWSAATTYAKNAIVRYGGLMYISLQNSNTNHIPPSTPTFWEQTTITQIETDILNAFP